MLKPAVGATAGYLGARVLGNLLPMDPTWGRPLAGIGTIAAVFVLSPKIGLVRENAGPLIMGAGLTLLQDILARILGGGGGASAAPVVSGLGEYVTEPVLGEYYDVSDQGTPYDSMMGAYYAEGVDPGDMATVEGMLTEAEQVAGVDVYQAAAGGLGRARAYYAAAGLGADVPMRDTVEPINAAHPAAMGPGIAEPITEQFATPEGRGYAGGIFARHLFSGMMGG